MSTAKVRVFEAIPKSGGGEGALQVPMEPGVDITPVTFTGTAGHTGVLHATRDLYVGVIADAEFNYLVGVGATALTTSWGPFTADIPIFFGVKRGCRISFIAAP